MVLSLAQKILKSKRTVVLFHTWTVTRELLAQAIREERSMDLDVGVDDSGNGYLGHSKEYHEKTRESFFNSMPLWEAVEALSRSNIPVMVDCKHVGAWPVVENVVTGLRPERCLVCAFASELKFDAGRADGEPDFVTEWSSIENLREMKRKFLNHFRLRGTPAVGPDVPQIDTESECCPPAVAAISPAPAVTGWVKHVSGTEHLRVYQADDFKHHLQFVHCYASTVFLVPRVFPLREARAS